MITTCKLECYNKIINKEFIIFKLRQITRFKKLSRGKINVFFELKETLFHGEKTHIKVIRMHV